MNDNTIKSISCNNEHIDILFNENWYQEDIHFLKNLLLAKVTNHQLKESIVGADRESIRFQWLDAEFIINFDYYSQSCWLSPNDDASQNKIHSMFNLLKV